LHPLHFSVAAGALKNKGYGLGKKARNAGSVNALQYPPQFKRLLQVTVLAAVKAALTAGNPFLALRRDRNPVLNPCVPVQIAIINYLAFFQDPRASRGRGYCLFRLTHRGVYSVIGQEKAERGRQKGLRQRRKTRRRDHGRTGRQENADK